VSGLTLFKASKMDSGLRGCNRLTRTSPVDYVVGAEIRNDWDPVSIWLEGQNM